MGLLPRASTAAHRSNTGSNLDALCGVPCVQHRANCTLSYFFLHLSILDTAVWVPCRDCYIAGVAKFGFLWMAKVYMIPYWINVMWLDVVTFLHHTDKEVWESHQ